MRSYPPPILPLAGVSKTPRRLLTLGVGGVNGLWESLLETLWGHLLDSLGNEGWASGVRDRSLVLGRVGVVDLGLEMFKCGEEGGGRNRKTDTHRVREGVLESLGSLLLDGVGDNRLTLGVDGVGLVGGRHGWLVGWFVCLVGSVEVEIEVGMRNASVGRAKVYIDSRNGLFALTRRHWPGDGDALVCRAMGESWVLIRGSVSSV